MSRKISVIETGTMFVAFTVSAYAQGSGADMMRAADKMSMFLFNPIFVVGLFILCVFFKLCCGAFVNYLKQKEMCQNYQDESLMRELE